jgi:hypothetical protein
VGRRVASAIACRRAPCGDWRRHRAHNISRTCR